MRTPLRVFGLLALLTSALCAGLAFGQAGTACCLREGGCVDSVIAADCEAIGGQPFGACSTCDEIECPHVGCIGATGDCSEPFTTPGCNSLSCCTYLCDDLPHCCTDNFDEQCLISCDCGAPSTACCLPDGSCITTEPACDCYDLGGVPNDDLLECPGDVDGDGIDEACGCGMDVPATSGWWPLTLVVILVLATSIVWLRRRGQAGGVS
jgi:hypothetical protein